ncbi:hypothetical protein GCM10025886_18390 [Tetragenococcus halophilus subsp. flandriensis]|nr:hypothetical protein GCM10025886_18390 [Tetragenococcus halophilus subsp. flandriensis]
MCSLLPRIGFITFPQLCVRYYLELDLLPLVKSENPDHIKSNAKVDFEISTEDMNKLKNINPIKDYGEASEFPVYQGNLNQS